MIMVKKKYDNDFKIMIAELLLSGISGSQVSREYDLSVSMIGRWRREYVAKQGDFSKKKEVSETKKELRDLKKKLRDVTMERDILKKAVSIFSKSDL
jgi:transposase